MGWKSALRWWTTGAASAASTCGGTGVGPGVNRYCFSGIGPSVVPAGVAARAVARFSLRARGRDGSVTVSDTGTGPERTPRAAAGAGSREAARPGAACHVRDGGVPVGVTSRARRGVPYTRHVAALVAFAAALVALRLAGALAARRRATRRPELAAWAASLAAYAVAAAAIAWGEAAGWDARAFRVYYAAGALLTAPLLGAGSLLLAGRGWATPVALVYSGLALGVALAMPVHGAFALHGIPPAQEHLAFLPARLLAILANALGTLAVVAVAL